MTGLRALRLTLRDLWQEAFVILSIGFIGGLLSLLIIPLPFVLAGTYGVALRIAGGRIAGWREWYEDARAHARFFYKWALLVALVVVVLLTNVNFYWNMAGSFGEVAGGVAMGLLIVWLLLQPYVPALYLLHHRLLAGDTPSPEAAPSREGALAEVVDGAPPGAAQRGPLGLRESLRRSIFLALRNPVATLLPWPLTFALLVAVGGLGLWPAALVLPALWAVYYTRAVALAVDVVEEL
ncbi:MAG: hypothetical protein R3272_13300 [Candidatus Promineifilaceae bacterium]|nr:hypothetical protein [Candidatus Promineifilaceae bacterium]